MNVQEEMRAELGDAASHMKAIMKANPGRTADHETAKAVLALANILGALVTQADGIERRVKAIEDRLGQQLRRNYESIEKRLEKLESRP